MHLWQLFGVLFNWLCHVITDCLQQKVLRAPYFYQISIKHNYMGLPKIWGVGHPRPKFWGCLDTHESTIPAAAASMYASKVLRTSTIVLLENRDYGRGLLTTVNSAAWHVTGCRPVAFVV